ncbi:hypothetical protein [Psychroflexus planctonicus]|uniref:Lipoprotein n=1 Tax=Psychroflexus planctonicus TaxID=1526575 RepID=A0ABQ1SIA3_9FLAO|nr:hypothetical protein [Psychroflexus planctonicus]GGE40937.1 hypothetical protein GCM10010832_21270 [Psychroflexus planctonicus]
MQKIIKPMVIKNLKLIVLILAVVGAISCDSLLSVLEEVETQKKDLTNNNNLKEDQVNLNDAIKNLSKESKFALSKNLNSDESLVSYYDNNYIDSLKNELEKTGVLKLKTEESFLIDYLKTANRTDTTYLANLYFNSPVNGEVLSYEYNVLKDDVIYYEISNLKSHKLMEISISEGGTTRFLKNDLKPKETVKGQIEILSDNVLTVNVSNDNFIKNKGFLQSHLKLVLKKIKPNLNFKVKKTKDTIVNQSLIRKSIKDTIYRVIDSKEFSLGNKLDLTKNHTKKFNVIVNEFDNLLGWSYWIGVGDKQISAYNKMAESENPLIEFTKSELLKSENKTLLPKNENADVDLEIKNTSLDARSSNYFNNYAFYKSDEYTTSIVKKAEVYLSNKSSLYDYNVKAHIVAVGLNEVQQDVLEDIVAYKDIIFVTLLDDE